MGRKQKIYTLYHSRLFIAGRSLWVGLWQFKSQSFRSCILWTWSRKSELLPDWCYHFFVFLFSIWAAGGPNVSTLQFISQVLVVMSNVKVGESNYWSEEVFTLVILQITESFSHLGPYCQWGLTEIKMGWCLKDYKRIGKSFWTCMTLRQCTR